MRTAGTDRMPSVFARLATLLSFMSCTVTSHDEHATPLMISIASWQAEQPALKTSILRLLAIFDSLNGPIPFCL